MKEKLILMRKSLYKLLEETGKYDYRFTAPTISLHHFHNSASNP